MSGALPSRGPPPIPLDAQEKIHQAALPLERMHDDCRRGHHSGVYDAISEKPDLVNAVGNLGYTALMWAAHSGHADICELLLHSKANVNAQNNNGDTALHLAVWRSHAPVVTVLIREEWKADQSLRNQDGKTAEELARSEAVLDALAKPAAGNITFVQEDDDSDDE